VVTEIIPDHCNIQIQNGALLLNVNGKLTLYDVLFKEELY